MPRLTKIYTRKGDHGETSLGDGKRIPKTATRVRAYGSVDELNSAIGAALAHGLCARLNTNCFPSRTSCFIWDQTFAFWKKTKSAFNCRSWKRAT